eukprot:7986278-Pyramimonas_sp.AAC.1
MRRKSYHVESFDMRNHVSQAVLVLGCYGAQSYAVAFVVGGSCISAWTAGALRGYPAGKVA